jgi:signal peptidase I
LVPLLIIFVTVTGIRFVFYDVSRVSGDSMLPTLRNNEDLLITRGVTLPRRGYVVVLQRTTGKGSEELVKRIVALGGDQVSVRGDFVTVNGRPEYFDHEIIVGTEQLLQDVKVPAGMVFVLGDNRAISLDSRFFGCLPVSAIHGRVLAVWSPLTRMRVIPSP